MSDTPKCGKCGLEITTGAMAAFCPNAAQCEFWPHSDGTPNGDGAELLIARMWIGNACEQIGMQIDDRERLQRELSEARAECDTHKKSLDMLYGEKFSDRNYHALKSRAERAEAECERLNRALAEIREEWAGAECGEPITAQEAYAIQLCKRMYRTAVDAIDAARKP